VPKLLSQPSSRVEPLIVHGKLKGVRGVIVVVFRRAKARQSSTPELVAYSMEFYAV
jgi:hypothetical protein